MPKPAEGDTNRSAKDDIVLLKLSSCALPPLALLTVWNNNVGQPPDGWHSVSTNSIQSDCGCTWYIFQCIMWVSLICLCMINHPPLTVKIHRQYQHISSRTSQKGYQLISNIYQWLDCLSVEGSHPQTGHRDALFRSRLWPVSDNLDRWTWCWYCEDVHSKN